MKLQSDYLPENTALPFRTNQKKKGKIRFKCLHCDYLTFKKQNLVRHLRQKHEVHHYLFILKLRLLLMKLIF